MGELKPIGSEKLKGDAKLKRILELTYYNSSDNSEKSSEVIKESSNGVYGIVKEKDGYYVKRGLNENSMDYIGGLYMKNKNRFTSYGEALKKLEFLTEQENLQEATKYVLKRPAPAPQAEAPAPMPTNEPPAPAAAPDPTAMDVPDNGTPPATGDDLGGEDPNANPEDYLKIIQAKTGKLTQKLSTYKDKLKSDDIKYVINMVLAAVDLNKLDETDKDDIASKFENDEESGEESSDMGSPVPEAGGEVGGMGSGETGGIDPINSLEELINEPFGDDDFIPYDPDEDEDELYDIGPDDYKATKAAKQDIEKDMEGMDDEEDDILTDPLLDSSLEDENEFNSDSEKEVDEMGSGDDLVDPNNFQNGETTRGDDVKELDIEELTNMVNGSVKETLSKYFN
jgi:hypothetical protein